MAPLNSFTKITMRPEHDFMHIKRTKGKPGRMKFGISSIQFIDKDTNQFVLYVPSLDISSYGETLEQAEEMLKSSVDDFCEYLLSLKADSIATELKKLGWVGVDFHLQNKQFFPYSLKDSQLSSIAQ